MRSLKNWFVSVLGPMLMICALSPVHASAEPWHDDIWRDVPYDFIDMIDPWGPGGADAALIVQGYPLT